MPVYIHIRSTVTEEIIMTATYTADIFSTVDGFGAPIPGTWGGYWDKQGAELLDHRLALHLSARAACLSAPHTGRVKCGASRIRKRSAPASSPSAI